jgi:hypothetical protein
MLLHSYIKFGASTVTGRGAGCREFPTTEEGECQGVMLRGTADVASLLGLSFAVVRTKRLSLGRALWCVAICAAGTVLLTGCGAGGASPAEEIAGVRWDVGDTVYPKDGSLVSFQISQSARSNGFTLLHVSGMLPANETNPVVSEAFSLSVGSRLVRPEVPARCGETIASIKNKVVFLGYHFDVVFSVTEAEAVREGKRIGYGTLPKVLLDMENFTGVTGPNGRASRPR